jgi:hypothetical protein
MNTNHEIPPPWVAARERSGSGWRAVVRVPKPVHYDRDDEEVSDWRSPDIQLLHVPTPGGTIVRVFAGYTDGRKALRTFLEWVLGEAPPFRGSEVENYLAPMVFTEPQVVALAARLGMSCCVMQGRDMTGEVGEIELAGKPLGAGLAPLDPSTSLVSTQQAAPHNSLTYNYTFQHQDGFEEHTRAQFIFKGRAPMVAFPARISHPALDHLLGELLSNVGAGP